MCIAAPSGRLGLRGAAARLVATSAPRPGWARGRVTYEPYVMRNAILASGVKNQVLPQHGGRLAPRGFSWLTRIFHVTDLEELLLSRARFMALG